jgi:transposase
MARYGDAIRRRAVALLRLRAAATPAQRRLGTLSYRGIAAAVGVANHATIEAWDRQRRAAGVVATASATRGRPTKLPRRERELIVGWALHQAAGRRSPTAREVSSFAADVLGRRLDKCAVSRLMSAFGVRSRRRRRANDDGGESHLRDDVTHFLRDVDRLALLPGMVVVIDETAVYVDDDRGRGYTADPRCALALSLHVFPVHPFVHPLSVFFV